MRTGARRTGRAHQLAVWRAWDRRSSVFASPALAEPRPPAEVAAQTRHARRDLDQGGVRRCNVEARAGH
eukprot:2026732-Rhodomonas_salina.1